MTPMHPQQLNIAIADDHAILRDGLARVLNDYEDLKVVAQANNGAQLIASIRQMHTPPDVCILDVNMPVMDGYATATAIRAEWGDIKILALSMFDSEYNIIRMLRAGASGYMLKDASPTELHRAILTVYKTGFYHSELVTGRMLHQIIQTEHATTDLTLRELTFLKLCCTELTYKEIADLMIVSPRTVDGYRESLFKKLQLNTRVGLAMYAIRAGLVIPGAAIPDV